MKAELVAKWMFVVSTVLTLGDGMVALVRADYTVGILGLAAAIASAAGAIASDSAAKRRAETKDTFGHTS